VPPNQPVAHRVAPMLHRENAGASRRPVRIVHLGLGNFFRAHAAWYTERADPCGEWGIAGFTGRTVDAAEVLTAQDDLYTLVERGPLSDHYSVIGALSLTRDGTDQHALSDSVASAATVIITATITEAGYVPADIDPQGVPARLAIALAARKNAGGGPLAVVSCDNLPRNGEVLRQAIVAGQSEELTAWIATNVSFVSTSVDRITPRATKQDVEEVRRSQGYVDRAPVITEPYSAWVLSGAFPAGRPRWEDAGAIFVEDLDGYVLRKLWLLNGAHSLLAYAGRLRGHSTVSGAIQDQIVRSWVEEFWRTGAALLPDPTDAVHYTVELQARFSNPRIVHKLDQIATDGVIKLRTRILPMIVAADAAGLATSSLLRVICSWIADVMSDRTSVPDAEEHAIRDAARCEDSIAALLALVDPWLGGDRRRVDECRQILRDLGSAGRDPELDKLDG